MAVTLEQHVWAKRRVGAEDPLDDWVLTEVTIKDKTPPQIHVTARSISPLLVGKRIVIVGIAGAHAATADKRISECVRFYGTWRACGVDEVWCVVIHSPYVLGLWALDALAAGRIRFFSDRDGSWTRAIGLDSQTFAVDGQVRALPYSLIVEDGVVKYCRCANTAQDVDTELGDLVSTLSNGYSAYGVLEI